MKPKTAGCVSLLDRMIDMKALRTIYIDTGNHQQMIQQTTVCASFRSRDFVLWEDAAYCLDAPYCIPTGEVYFYNYVAAPRQRAVR